MTNKDSHTSYFVPHWSKFGITAYAGYTRYLNSKHPKPIRREFSKLTMLVVYLSCGSVRAWGLSFILFPHICQGVFFFGAQFLWPNPFNRTQRLFANKAVPDRVGVGYRMGGGLLDNNGATDDRKNGWEKTCF